MIHHEHHEPQKSTTTYLSLPKRELRVNSFPTVSFNVKSGTRRPSFSSKTADFSAAGKGGVAYFYDCVCGNTDGFRVFMRADGRRSAGRTGAKSESKTQIPGVFPGRLRRKGKPEEASGNGFCIFFRSRGIFLFSVRRQFLLPPKMRSR